MINVSVSVHNCRHAISFWFGYDELIRSGVVRIDAAGSTATDVAFLVQWVLLPLRVGIVGLITLQSSVIGRLRVDHRRALGRVVAYQSSVARFSFGKASLLFYSNYFFKNKIYHIPFSLCNAHLS